LPASLKPLRTGLRALGLAVIGSAVAAPIAHAGGISPETPRSPNADEIDAAYTIALVVFAVVVLAVNGALVATVMRNRTGREGEAQRIRSGRRTPRRAGLALGVVAVALFVVGVVYAERASDVESSGPGGLQAAGVLTAQRGISPPAGDEDPLTIQVAGQQWLWRYEYPNGTFSYYEMVVPVDTTVILELESTDVLHRWWVPALGGKFDAVPGQSNRTWFRAEEEGTFDGQSAAFSGPGYPAMRARVRVVSPTDYEAWLEQQAADIAAAQTAVQREVAAGTAPGVR
jgi:cytochrome c oxidase subunit 2